MGFREYLRLDGALTLAAGLSLVGLGLLEHHQGPVDASISGVVMLAGTAAFMRFRHKLGPRTPGAWYTARALEAAEEARPECPRPKLVARLVAAVIAGSALVFALSALSGFWLTYVDVGIWAIAVGTIKLGPGCAAIDRFESRRQARYLVAERSMRGVVSLTRRRSDSRELA